MADDRRRDESRPADPAEGVRIIGAEEAAEAIERGDVAARRGGDLPRYGDRPARPPVGPKPALRFPLDPGSEPPESALRPAKGTRYDPRPARAWDDPIPDDEAEGDPWPAESTWGEPDVTWDESATDDVVAWTSGETGTQPVVETPPAEASDALSWADEFVGDGEDEAWDGNWGEPTSAVRWADEADGDTGSDEAGSSAAGDAGEPVDATATSDPEPPKRARGLFSRRSREVPVVEADATGADDDPEPVVDVSDRALHADPAIDGRPDPDATADLGGIPAPPDGSGAEPRSDDPWPSEEVGAVDEWGSPAEPRAGSLFDADGGWADPDANTSAGAPVFDFVDEPSGQVELPHWTEPATGELPKVFVDDAESSAAAPAARWRGDDTGWGDGDFDDLIDLGDDVRVGAMDVDRPHDEDLYSFEELEEPVPDVEPVASGPLRREPPARPHPGPAPSGGGGAGRNLGVATVVGVAAAALAIGLMFLGAKYVMALLVVVVAAMIGEYQNAVRRAGYRPAALFGIVATVCFPLAVYWKGIEAYPVLLVLTVGAALAWHLVGADGDARVVESVGVTVFGVAWVGGLGSFAALLLSLPDGTGMLAAAVLAAVGYDVGGLAIGRTMGTRPLSEASPNKTVEGLVGGMFISLAVSLIVVGLFGIAPFDGPGAALKIGFLAALAAPLGDLCESLVKRDLGIKDMSSLLPEHGGVLDRFDALLFVLPAVYYGAVLFGLGPF